MESKARQNHKTCVVIYAEIELNILSTLYVCKTSIIKRNAKVLRLVPFTR